MKLKNNFGNIKVKIKEINETKKRRKIRKIIVKKYTKKKEKRRGGTKKKYSLSSSETFITENPIANPTKRIKNNHLSENIENIENNQYNQYNLQSLFDAVEDAILVENQEDKDRDYLQRVCINSGDCLLFGKEIEKIKQFFDYFRNFNYVDQIQRLNSNSKNGIITEIKYNKSGYISYAILKSAQFNIKFKIDNIAYEYLVGLFLNEQSKYFPCFLETYGLFHKPTNEQINLNNKDDLKKLKILSQEDDGNFKIKSCNNNNLYLLIQHLHNSRTLSEYYKEIKKTTTLPIINYNQNNYEIINKSVAFYLIDFIHILYQIYMPLYCLARTGIFTHNDLHRNNVLLFEIPNNDYIHFKYNVNGINTEFNCKFIVKIIDYGRCYFHYNDESKNHASINICKNYLTSVFSNINKKIFDLSTVSNNTLDTKIFNSFFSPKANNVIEAFTILHQIIHNPINNLYDNPPLNTNLYGTINVFSDMQTPVSFIMNNSN